MAAAGGIGRRDGRQLSADSTAIARRDSIRSTRVRQSSDMVFEMIRAALKAFYRFRAFFVDEMWCRG
jgi:hypothetical protein